MDTQKEAKIQKQIIDYLKKVPNLYFIKTIVSNRRGIPDIHLCYRGMYVALEVKRLGEDATALQEYELSQIRKAGGFALVVRSVEDVRQVIETLDLQISKQ